MIDNMTFIHPSAEIESGVEIGEGSKIWALCYLQRGARIGRECVLGRGVCVGTSVRIGNRVKIQHLVQVLDGVTLEDHVFVGPYVAFTNDRLPRAVNSDLSLKTSSDWVKGQTLVRQGASIGAHATIICGVTIGRWAMVGAGSVVTKDVPDFAKVIGIPARIVGYVCRCGNELEKTGKACAAAHCRAGGTLLEDNL